MNADPERLPTRDRILIVEDQPELAEVLDYQLQAQGFATLVAGSGLQACRLAGRENPDLILLDILLPDLDGWEVCRLIRARGDEKIGSVPIVMLTALGSMPDRLRGLEIGADAFIAKPYSIREVVLTARRLITRRRQENSLTDEVLRLRDLSRHETAIQDILCHELRNQLLILRGFSGLLGKSGRDSEEENRTCINAIARSSQTLGNLAESLLLLRRCENEGLSLPVDHPDVSPLLQETVALYRPFADQKRVGLELDCPADLQPSKLNGLGLRLVVANLVENAIKYSPPGSKVNVQATMEDEETLQIVVEDDGPGVPEQQRERIFQRFVRGPGHDATIPGSGLGLYIARSLAQSMGGNIAYRPVEPHCIRFAATFHGQP